MAEKFPNPTKNLNQHFQGAQQSPSRINTKRFTNRHIVVKLLKLKQGENVESIKRKMTHHLQWNSNNINN